MRKFVLFALVLVSCVSSKKFKINNNQPFNQLTNNSIKFWETNKPIQNTRLGLYFTKDGICDEYLIHNNKKRVLEVEGDLIFERDKPFHFTLKQDSLNLYLGDSIRHYFRLHWFKILKLTNDSLIVQETYGPNKPLRNEPWTATFRYFAPKDQHTKPQYTK